MNTARIIYAVHSGRLYGTERMALATLEQLAHRHEVELLAPDGPVHDEARRLGIRSRRENGPLCLARATVAARAQGRRPALILTRTRHSLGVPLLRSMLATSIPHLHVVHGGMEERISYGNKRHAARAGARMVAVSRFVASRLRAHRVPERSLAVVPNFLSRDRRAGLEGPCCCARRAPLREILVISRLEPNKRVALLLEAVSSLPRDERPKITVLGTGSEREALAAYARERGLRVDWRGWTDDITPHLHRADLLWHGCPDEPFGLVLLEAMHAGVPLCVPDRGGADEVAPPAPGAVRYRADDALDLRDALQVLTRGGPGILEAMAHASRAWSAARFDAHRAGHRYEELLFGGRTTRTRRS